MLRRPLPRSGLAILLVAPLLGLVGPATTPASAASATVEDTGAEIILVERVGLDLAALDPGHLALVEVAADGSHRREIAVPAGVRTLVEAGKVTDVVALPGGEELVLSFATGTGIVTTIELLEIASGRRTELATGCGRRVSVDADGEQLAYLQFDPTDQLCHAAVLSLTSSAEPLVTPARDDEIFDEYAVIAPDGRGVYRLVRSLNEFDSTLNRIVYWDLATGDRTILASGDLVQFEIDEPGADQVITGVTVTDWFLYDVAPDGSALVTRQVTTSSNSPTQPFTVETTTGTLGLDRNLSAIDVLVAGDQRTAQGGVYGVLRMSPQGDRLLATFGNTLPEFDFQTVYVRPVHGSSVDWRAVPDLGWVGIPSWGSTATATPPVIFLPGLLGSELWCDPSAGSPVWPALGVSESFVQLQADGETNAS
ncbi:MAG: hypothetical protein F2667_09940, partial [Actinobacteria bacterium]|nr:hypothetical protein [Actinomycetota bacterium]